MTKKTIKTDFSKTGWVEIPGDTNTIVAHFKDGTTKEYALFEFATLKKSEKINIVQIDCE